MRHLLILVISLLLVAGCATQPSMSRADYLGMTTREYPDATAEQVFAAAEAMFEFSAPGTFQFAHHDTGMRATETGMFALFSWSLNVTKMQQGVRVQVGVTGPGVGGLAPTVGTGGAMGFGATPGGATPIVDRGVYEVFWTRLEYMLGKRASWMTCKQAREHPLGAAPGSAARPLCSTRLFSDPLPEGPVVRR